MIAMNVSRFESSFQAFKHCTELYLEWINILLKPEHVAESIILLQSVYCMKFILLKMHV